MDFTKFSDENFDLKDWINGAFVSQKETNQNQEVYAQKKNKKKTAMHFKYFLL